MKGFFFPVDDSQKVKRVFWKVCLVSACGESRDLVFSPSRSNLGLVSSRLGQPLANHEIYNLSMVSGPVLLKVKGTSWIFIFGGVKQTNKKMKMFDEIGQILVSRALDRTKKIRKIAADIFAKSGFENP